MTRFFEGLKYKIKKRDVEMSAVCYQCFRDTVDSSGVCAACGYNNGANREKYPLALSAGAILYGRYIIGKVLGQGGYGITYLAQDYQTKELVAIKEFFPDAMATRMGSTMVTPFTGNRGENFHYGRTCFLEEARTMAEFSENPNVAGVQMYFEENGTGYYVMEYIDGTSFENYIRTRGGRLSWEETWNVMLPVLDALEAVHDKGIIHRDVAPDNIYITKDGRVKLLDFGAARHSLGNVSQSLDVILKHGFAPKEQYSRRGRQGPYTDVYAASATMYYALTGAKPDDAIDRTGEDNMPPPTVLGARISLELEDALLKGLAVEARDRYQTVGELRRALAEAAAVSAAPGIPWAAAPAAQFVPAPRTVSQSMPQPTPQPVVTTQLQPAPPVVTTQQQYAPPAVAPQPVVTTQQQYAPPAVAPQPVVTTQQQYAPPVVAPQPVAPTASQPVPPTAEQPIVPTASQPVTPAAEKSAAPVASVPLKKKQKPAGSKKKKILLAAICAVLLLAVGFAAFWIFHPHSYGDWETVRGVTCTDAGLRQRACFCGHTEQTQTAPAGHSFTRTAAVPATCKDTGLSEGIRCSACGVYQEGNEPKTLPKLEHEIITLAAKAPTCEEDGLTEGTGCKNCDFVKTEQKTLAATGHDKVTVPGKAATCASTGLSDGERCKTCNKTLKAQEELPKTDHKRVTDPAIPASCTSEGMSERVYCSVCNTVLKERTVTEGKKSHEFFRNNCQMCGTPNWTATIALHDNGSYVTYEVDVYCIENDAQYGYWWYMYYGDYEEGSDADNWSLGMTTFWDLYNGAHYEGYLIDDDCGRLSVAKELRAKAESVVLSVQISFVDEDDYCGVAEKRIWFQSGGNAAEQPGCPMLLTAPAENISGADFLTGYRHPGDRTLPGFDVSARAVQWQMFARHGLFQTPDSAYVPEKSKNLPGKAR